MNTQEHKEILRMALLGYDRQRDDIAIKMLEIATQLGLGIGPDPETPTDPATGMALVAPTFAVKPRKRKKRSAEVRARMAEAQRLRWRRIKKGQVRFA